MSTTNRSQATTILRNLGWRIRTTTEYTKVVKRFQEGWNLGTALDADGSVGPLTSAALLLSESRRRAGKPTASAHFSFSEVACRCGGQYPSCKRIWQKRSAFRMMEGYRSKSGRPSTPSPPAAAQTATQPSAAPRPLVTSPDVRVTSRPSSPSRR